MTEYKIDEAAWRFMKQRLGYDDEEFEKFRNDPRNEKVLRRAALLSNKTVVFEVVKSHGCNIEHKLGDKFYFSAEGYMLAHKGPKKVCPFILAPMARLVWLVQERLYEELDPLPTFGIAHCEDVGIDCGGWGRVVFETKVIDRQK